ncbi:unnamed protein product [Paramecium sonneborni]|uniref:Uncharacterized protein n=1 Tax=Paramecium sonneborni TaxID=65129 RepID=A0A8S1PQZ8_9CILI|nr:unnamed protein product [Paramecium sonneborni]
MLSKGTLSMRIRFNFIRRILSFTSNIHNYIILRLNQINYPYYNPTTIDSPVIVNRGIFLFQQVCLTQLIFRLLMIDSFSKTIKELGLSNSHLFFKIFLQKSQVIQKLLFAFMILLLSNQNVLLKQV